jgi:transposase
MSIPGVGPLIATAIEALAPPVETFRSGRDFAAWIGLTPLQRSTGGKERLGRISRMGERTLRYLLIVGASGVVRWAKRKGAPAGSWLAHAGEQAADAGDRCPGQQDGTHRLDLDC